MRTVLVWAAYGGNFLTFGDGTDCPETSVRNYHYTLRNSTEERSSYLIRGGSLKSYVVSSSKCFIIWQPEDDLIQVETCDSFICTSRLCCLMSRVVVDADIDTGARGGAVGWGTALQAGRSRVRFPMVSLEFFIDNPSGRTMALGSTQPLTEMSTRNISWGVKAAGA